MLAHHCHGKADTTLTCLWCCRLRILSPSPLPIFIVVDELVLFFIVVVIVVVVVVVVAGGMLPFWNSNERSKWGLVEERRRKGQDVGDG